jgi:hypothetical protein
VVQVDGITEAVHEFLREGGEVHIAVLPELLGHRGHALLNEVAQLRGKVLLGL